MKNMNNKLLFNNKSKDKDNFKFKNLQNKYNSH